MGHILHLIQLEEVLVTSEAVIVNRQPVINFPSVILIAITVLPQSHDLYTRTAWLAIPVVWHLSSQMTA